MRALRSRLTYANVMSTIAVFLVLGGATAFAAGHLGKNTVGSKQLKKNAVTAAKLKKNAVTESKIAKDAITAEKIKNGAVTGAKVDTASPRHRPQSDERRDGNHGGQRRHLLGL